MDTELRERFEEAAKEYAERELNQCAGSDWRRGDVRIEMLMSFEDGAEYGYKEAIKMAKEWLRYNVHRYIYAVNEDGIPQAGIGAAVFSDDFETDMNKLWEE